MKRVSGPAALRGVFGPRALRGRFGPATQRGVSGPPTLRGRLARAATAASVVWIAVATVAFNALLGSQLHAQADDVLRTRAEAVLATVEVRPEGLQVRDPADDTALDAGVWIFDGDRPVEQPGAGAELDADARALAGQATAPRLADRGAHRLYAVPVVDGGRRAGTVVTALSTSPYRAIADTALAGSVVLGLLLLVGIHVLARRMVRRALRPVTAMSEQAAAWSGSDLARRFGSSPRPPELAALAGHLDALLDRIAVQVRHEQQLSNELSHELRTPLARIAAETEWLLRRPRDAADLARTHRAIARDATVMQEICHTLLSTARPGAAVVPAATAVVPVLERLASGAGRGGAGPSVAVLRAESAAGRTAAVPAALIERILAPLVENALRHARGEVTLVVAAEGPGVRISVLDDGPGLPAQVDDIEQAVFEPGFRADPGDGHGGAGLGLALARRLARQAGGDVVGVAGGGGGRFDVSLPG